MILLEKDFYLIHVRRRNSRQYDTAASPHLANEVLGLVVAAVYDCMRFACNDGATVCVHCYIYDTYRPVEDSKTHTRVFIPRK